MRSLLRLLAVSLLLVALFGGTAGAAIVVDATSSAAGTGTSITWSHTVGTGLNRLLVVGVSVHDGKTTVSAATYGGVPLTNIGTHAAGKGNASVSLWGLVAPASGTAPVNV